MGDYYNISGENDEILMVTREELVNLYDEHKEDLLYGHAFNDIEARVLANHKGYITYMIEGTHIIDQCWAGQFTIGRRL